MDGQWIIAGTNVRHETLQLLQIGSQRFPGGSVRKNLSKEQRLLLYNHLETAVHTGQGCDQLENIGTATFHVRVLPLLSPATETPVGACAVYVPADKHIPPVPLVGCFEWIIGDERQIYWDRNLCRVYGMGYEEIESTEIDGKIVYLPPTEWAVRWIDPADQDRIERMAQTAVSNEISEAGVVNYRVHNPQTGESKVLELTASNIQRDNGTMKICGMTREVDRQGGNILPEDWKDPGPQIEALIEMTADIPLAQVKIDTGEPVQVLPGWTTAGLPNLQDQHIYELFSPHDRIKAQRLLGDAAQPGEVRVLREATIRNGRGHWLTVDVWLKPLGDGYAMFRLRVS